VLFIIGMGRSGSTVLEMLLGNIPGYFSVGETRFFWEYVQHEHDLCGCGQQFHACEYWGPNIKAIAHQFDLPAMADLVYFKPIRHLFTQWIGS
jgi:hypothetical protein